MFAFVRHRHEVIRNRSGLTAPSRSAPARYPTRHPTQHDLPPALHGIPPGMAARYPTRHGGTVSHPAWRHSIPPVMAARYPTRHGGTGSLPAWRHSSVDNLERVLMHAERLHRRARPHTPAVQRSLHNMRACHEAHHVSCGIAALPHCRYEQLRPRLPALHQRWAIAVRCCGVSRPQLRLASQATPHSVLTRVAARCACCVRACAATGVLCDVRACMRACVRACVRSLTSP